MARRGVNVLVSVGSAATLAASVAGVAAADGYWPGGTGDEDVSVGIVSDEAAVDFAPVEVLGLSPLPPMELSPLDSPELPRLPVAQTAPPTGMVQAPAPASAPPRAARKTKAS